MTSFRKMSHLVSVVAIAGCLMAAGSMSGPLFSDRFSSGTDANWTHLDILSLLGAPFSTIYDASSGRYEMSSNLPLPPLPFQTYGGAFVTDSLGNPQFRNVKIKATVRFNNSNSNVALGGRTTPDSSSGFAFLCNNVTNEITIQRIDPIPSGPVPVTIFDLVSAPFEFTEGVDYVVVARLTGTHLKMKVWQAGGNPPNHSQLSVDDSAYQQESLVPVGVFNAIGVGGQISGSVDNVKVTHLDEDEDED